MNTIELTGYFEYAGTKSYDYGMQIVNIDTARNLQMVGETKQISVFNKKGIYNYHMRDRYEDAPLVLDVEFYRDSGVIEGSERAEIERWLFHSGSFQKLYMMADDGCDGEPEEYQTDEDGHPVYLNCRFLHPVKIENGAGTVGYQATLEADAPFAWANDEQEFEPAGTGTVTLTGGIITADGYSSRSVTDLKADINHVQDLNGYDHPWPAGGGGNLWSASNNPIEQGAIGSADGQDTDVDNRVRCKGYITVTGSEKYTFAAHAVSGRTEIQDVFVLEYAADGTYLNLSSGWQSLPYTHTMGASTGKIRFCLRYTSNSAVAPSYIDWVTIVLGEAAIPCSNICPISGWTGARIFCTGKNLLDPDGIVRASTNVTVTKADGAVRVKNTLAGMYNSARGAYNNFTFKPGVTYTLSAHYDVISGVAKIAFRNKDGNRILANSATMTEGEGELSVSYTAQDGIEPYVSFFCTYDTAAEGEVVYTDLQLEIGAAKTSYADYAGSVYPISWQNEAGTVYDGHIDIDSGILTDEVNNVASYDPDSIPASFKSFIEDNTTLETEAQDDLVSFDCSLGEFPMKSLIAYIELVQDLHGYDGPWIDSNQINKDPYNFRAVSGTAPRFGTHLYDKLVGGTVAWNQHVRIVDKVGGSAITGYSGEVTVTSDGQYASFGLNFFEKNPPVNVQFPDGHKLFCSINVTDINVDNFYGMRFYSSKVNRFFTQEGLCQHIFETDGTKVGFRAVTSSGTSAVTDTLTAKEFMCIDLTQMFGSTIANYIYSLEQATAGYGIAKLKSWGFFLKDYYAYDPGSLQSVEASAHKMVGFNQWDEEWEYGGISSSTGAGYNSTDVIRSKNFCPILPNTIYYDRVGKTSNGTGNQFLFIYFYDSNQTYLGCYTAAGIGDGVLGIITCNSEFTTPANAAFYKLRTVNVDTNFSQNTTQICINLSDTNRNGQYEAYDAHTCALDSDLELRGIPKLDADNRLYYDGDTYESNGTVTRKYGIVDLGTLTYTQQDTNIVAVQKDNIQTVSGFNPKRMATAENLCSCFGASDIVQTTNQFRFASSVAATDFATTFNGQKLIFEIATPTTESADPFTNPQPFIDANGTEEYIDAGVTAATPTRDVAIPVGHETYHANICPIYGWTGLRSCATGKNLFIPKWDTSREVENVKFTPNADGSIHIKGTSNANTLYAPSTGSSSMFAIAQPLKAGQYKLKQFGAESISGVYLWMRRFDKDGNIIGSALATNNSYHETTFEMTSDGYGFVRVYVANSGTVIDTDVGCAIIRVPDTMNSYEPASGIQVDVSWQTAAGTVYKGYIDLISGVLTVTWYGYNLTDATGFTNPRTGTFRKALDTNFPYKLTNPGVGATVNAICNRFPVRTSDTVTAQNDYLNFYNYADSSLQAPIIYLRPENGSIANNTAFATWISSNPVQFYFELETPFTLQLTAQQINTLLGANRVWASTGDVSLQYYDGDVNDIDDLYTSHGALIGGSQALYPKETPDTYNLTPQQITLLSGKNNVWADTGDITLTYVGGEDLIEVEVNSDLPEYIWPKVTIETGDAGGNLQIVNVTDDPARLTTFTGLTANTQIIMNGETNYISGQNYTKFSNKNFIRLKNGVNKLSIAGNVDSISFTFKNRRFL